MQTYRYSGNKPPTTTILRPLQDMLLAGICS